MSQVAIGIHEVQPVIQSLLNITSAGGLRKRLKDLSISTLLHPFIVLILEDGSRGRLERNVQISIRSDKTHDSGDRWLTPYSKVNKTVGELFENHVRYIGGTYDSLIEYNPAGQNSQTFILGFLRANDLLTEKIRGFFDQDTVEIMKAFPGTNELVKKIVLLGLSLSVMAGSGSSQDGGFILPVLAGVSALAGISASSQSLSQPVASAVLRNKKDLTTKQRKKAEIIEKYGLIGGIPEMVKIDREYRKKK